MTDSHDSPARGLEKIIKRDLVTARAALEPWLAARMPQADALRLAAIEPTGGLSHEILKLDVRWREEGRDRAEGLIVRIDPTVFRKRRGSNLRREFDAMTALHALGEVPVPRPYWYETDAAVLGADFYVMEKINGQVGTDQPPYQLQGWIADMAPADRATLWREAIATIAKLHRTPVAPLAALRRNPAGNEDDFTQNLTHWHDTYRWAMDGVANPVADPVWEWLLTNLPANRPPGLSWGDARWANLMFDGQTCTAVLDWEDVALSTPLHDLGRWLFAERFHRACGYPTLDGFGDREATIGLWEDLSGLSAADIKWYEAFTVAIGIGLLVRAERIAASLSAGQVGPAKMTARTFTTLLDDIMAR